MKPCAYCGRENEDNAVSCRECGTEFGNSTTAAAPRESTWPKLQFTRLTVADREKDLVTLTTCDTLVQADLIVSRLTANQIPAFIPDEFLMQNVSFNVNTYGYVRVQVSPNDFDAAKELLEAGAQNVGEP